MDIIQVKRLVENNYNLKVKELEKVKNVYKITTEKKGYCLKVIKYELSHFLFIIGAIKHLKNNGFKKIPDIIPTSTGLDFIQIGNYYAYLTPWINARECNYDNPIDVKIATRKLAEFHKKSEGFQVSPYMNPRVGWNKWISTYETRKNEILDFKKRIEDKDIKSNFDILYLKMMEEELNRCDKSILNLKNSQYINNMKKEIKKKGFCHHDYAHHNILIDKYGEVNLIDFDYCILDSHLHDLSSLLIRKMKNGKWDLVSTEYILNEYNSLYSIQQSDIPIMAAFIEFPQEYWQIGIQYYWEKRRKSEEFFVKKLGKINEDKKERQEFVDKFRNYIF